MALVLPNVGEGIILNYVANIDAPENLVLRLFSNNVTPAETDTDVTYTEVTGGGYASKTLTGGDWTMTPGDPSDITASQQTFLFSGSVGDVYGYYFTRLTGTELMWSEVFTDGPYNIANSGDEIRVTPTFTLT